MEPVTFDFLSPAGIPSNFVMQFLQQKPTVWPSNVVVGQSLVSASPETGHLAFMALLLVVVLVLLHEAKKNKDAMTTLVRMSFMYGFLGC
jgi:hypothetical protein